MAMRSNVTRLLVKKNIPFRAHALPKAKLSALQAAEFLLAAPESVFKTIVTVHRPDNKIILALVPGTRQVDLKALARELQLKKVHLTTQREAEQITGLETGGISPLALLHKGFTVVADATIQGHGQIFLSGGQRGLNIQMAPIDLLALTNAQCLPITTPENPQDRPTGAANTGSRPGRTKSA